MINLKSLDLFKDSISIEEISYDSRCKNKYKIVSEDFTYFVKIEEDYYSLDDIKNTKWLYQRCLEENINVLPLVDIISCGEETIWIYPFFTGKEILKIDFDDRMLEDYGKRIAKDIKKFNKIEPIDTFRKIDLEEFWNLRINKIRDLLNEENTKNNLLKLLTVDKWEELLDYYKKLGKEVKCKDYFINHNDIKLPNILIDEDNNYYLIDFGPIILTSVGYNIGYSLSSFLFENLENKEKAFLRGFIKEIDANKELVREFNFYLISDFINKINKRLDDYLDNASYIKDLLFNRDNILEDVLYDNI